MYLYIIKFKNMDLIKIGLSSSDMRITQLMRAYKDIAVDLDSSFKVTAKFEYDLKMLEKQLLNDYIEYKIEDEQFNKRIGYKELRKGIILNSVLDDINYKAKKFPNKEFKLHKGIKLESSKTWEEKNKEIRENNNKVKENYLTFLKVHKDNISEITIRNNGAKVKFCNVNTIDAEKKYRAIGMSLSFSSDYNICSFSVSSAKYYVKSQELIFDLEWQLDLADVEILNWFLKDFFKPIYYINLDNVKKLTNNL